MKKIKEFFCDNWYFILLFILIFVLHFKAKNIGDDVYFANVLNSQNLISYLNRRYFYWSSRLIIDTLLVIFNGMLPRFVWMISDSLLYVGIAFLLSKLLNRKKNEKYNIVISALMLIYPFTDMGTAGYTSTTINYILPFFCMLYSFYIVDKSLHHKSIKIVEYILSLIATIVCCNMEQSCAVFFGFIFIIVLKQFVEDTNRKMFLRKIYTLFYY